MHPFVARTLGFAVPTVAVVTYGHLIVQATVGEAIDGVVSGLWFTALFAIGAGLREWWIRRGRAAGGPAAAAVPAGRMFLIGLTVGVLAWGALWAFWSIMPHYRQSHPETAVFGSHSTLMALMGWLGTPVAGTRARRTA